MPKRRVARFFGTSATTTEGDRRDSALVGPLYGCRCGEIRAPLRISNLTPAGCLIESREPEQVGVRMQLEIALPEDGWIYVNAEVSSILDGCGYVVAFLDLPAEAQNRIERAIRQ